MTIPTIEEQAEAFKALLRGEYQRVQWDDIFHPCGWREWQYVKPEQERSLHRFTAQYIRLKPTPKLRPWKPEEVPLGAFVRHKATKIETHINGRKGDGIALAHHIWVDCKTWTTCVQLFDVFEMLDGSPCGILDESP